MGAPTPTSAGPTCGAANPTCGSSPWCGTPPGRRPFTNSISRRIEAGRGGSALSSSWATMNTRTSRIACLPIGIARWASTRLGSKNMRLRTGSLASKRPRTSTPDIRSLRATMTGSMNNIMSATRPAVAFNTPRVISRKAPVSPMSGAPRPARCAARVQDHAGPGRA